MAQMVLFALLNGLLGLTPVFGGCCGYDHNVLKNETDPENTSERNFTVSAEEKLKIMDDLHIKLFMAKVLDSLGLDEPPSPPLNAAKRKRKQKNSISGTVHNDHVMQMDADHAEEKAHGQAMTMKITGIVLDQNFTTSESDQPCSTQYIFTAKFRNHHQDRKKVIVNGQIEVPLDYGDIVSNGIDVILKEDPSKTYEAHLSNPKVKADKVIFNVTRYLLDHWSPVNGSHTLKMVVQRRESGENRTCPDNDRASDENGDPILTLDITEFTYERHNKRQTNGKSGGNGHSDFMPDCDAHWSTDDAMPEKWDKQLSGDMGPCCRRKLNISFVQLQWDHWIVWPKSIDIHYCIGRCSSYLADPKNQFYADLMNLQKETGKWPCCAPIKFASVDVRVRKDPNVIENVTLDGVTTEKCGCL